MTIACVAPRTSPRTITRAAALAFALALCASTALAQGDVKPKPWTPGSAPKPSPADSARAAQAAAAAAIPPPPLVVHELPTADGATRPLDLVYTPSVPDSILPFVPVYQQVPIDAGSGSAYMGALRQQLPVRPYSVFLRGSTVQAHVDGGTGQTHVAIMVMLPWFGDILPLPRAYITLGVKLDDGAEQEWKLECTPGPNLYMPSMAPLPVSNPGLVIVPLPPGPHRLFAKIKRMDSAYALILLGQPRLAPLGVQKR
jgi:hypothetical protein